MVFSCLCCCDSSQNSIFLLSQQNKSSESKVNFRQDSNPCKGVIDLVKLAYVTKPKESITSWKRGSRQFWRIACSVLNKGKFATRPLFNALEVLSAASNKAKSFTGSFSQNSIHDDSEISLLVFPPRTNLKLHNIFTIPKMVRQVIANIASSKASGPDFIPEGVLKNSEPELPYIHTSIRVLFSRLLEVLISDSCI